MKLTNKQKYDRRDIERGELKLIRVGHSLWAMLRAAKRGKSQPLSEIRALTEAIETVVRLKQEYRADRDRRLAVRSAKVRQHFRRSR